MKTKNKKCEFISIICSVVNNIGKSKIAPLKGKIAPQFQELLQSPQLKNHGLSSSMFSHNSIPCFRYLSKSDQTKYVRPITVWIATDVEAAEGRAVLYAALKLVVSSERH